MICSRRQEVLTLFYNLTKLFDINASSGKGHSTIYE